MLERMRRLIVPAGLSVMVFALVNLVLSGPADAARRWLDEDLFVWDFKWSRPLPPADVVVLGDSQAMSGILPSEFAKRGVRMLNLGLPSQQPEGILPLIARIPPEARIALINVSPYFVFKSEVQKSFYNYYRTTAPFSFEELGLDRKLAGQNTGDAVYRMIKGLALFRFRDRLSPILIQSDPAAEMRRRENRSRLIEETLISENGFWVWKAEDPRRCGQAAPPPAAGIVSYKERPEAESALKLARERLRARGLQVVLVYIPFSDAWASLAEPGINQRVHNVMRRIGSESIVIETPDRSEYRGLFHDWTHLNYCGAQKYTAWLYDRLRSESAFKEAVIKEYR